MEARPAITSSMAVTTGERRIVSVLIGDLVGSTRIAEQLGPERSKFLVDEVMRIMAEQIRRFGGTVAQLRGDEIYAIFGAPMAHEDDSERAVLAALAIQRALARYADEVEAAYGVRLAARIGINTGPVVVSPAEDGDGSDPWNALGDTVNVAARLQNLAPSGGIVVGMQTKRQVEGCFELEELGDQELAGKSAPVPTFKVTGVRDTESLVLQRPLVGRDFELTVLERTMDGLIDGRGVLISIMGEPGIGKTRLVAEVRSLYRAQIRFIEGRGVSYGENFPYWPIRDLVREWLGVGASTPEARVRLELKAQLAELFDDAEEIYPFFASLIGLTLEPEAAERIRELNREGVQHRTFEAFSELLSRLAAERPLCLILEDLHWADEATIELLEAILPVTEEAAVGLFLLYRTEREHGSWHLGERARQLYPHRYREIELRPLPSDASRTLVGDAAEGEVPEEVAEILAERAGGNPFFLEEAFQDLVERGALKRQNGGWQLGVSPDELAIPALVQGALQARLDRLDAKAREILSLAAVIGRTFGMPLLERIVPRDELLPALSELQRLDLIVEKRRRPNPEYRFRHGLLQEVAYANLLDSTRRKLHKRVGEALEEINRESPEEVFALLARHFAEANEPEKAVEYLLKAGDAARALYADQDALEHYRKARDFLVRLGDERRARDTLFKMALAQHLAFNFEEAEELYDEAFCCRVEDTASGRANREHLDRRHEAGRVRAGRRLQLGRCVLHGAPLPRSAHDRRRPECGAGDGGQLPRLSDGLTYLFRLREGCKWSDGEPLTAEDFAFAWKSMREERTRTAFMMEDVEFAAALDERTLEVRLREPRNFFPYILASAWAFPWPKHRCQELGEDWRKPENLVGNGPFMLSEFDDDHALLVANPHWVEPRGNVRELHFDFKTKSTDVSERWKEGQYDLLPVYGESVRDAPETVAEIVPELWLNYLGFRADAASVPNLHLRKAFAHAVDREALLAGTNSINRPAVSGGAIPPAMPGHSHRVGLEYNPERARELLAEAGYPEGRGLPPIEVLVPSWFQFGDVLAEQWAAIGAKVRVTDETGLPDLYAIGTAHAWVTGWSADYPDPDGVFRGFFQTGWPFYSDDEILEKLDQARSLGNQDERMRLYHEIDRIWVTERAGIVPLAYGRTMLLRRPGYIPSG